MKKIEYLEHLKNELKKNNIADVDEIIGEYEQHFAFKLSDGFTEQEVAAKLGNVKFIAAQFESVKYGNEKNSAGNIVIKIALAFTAVFEAFLYLVFFAWSVVLGAAALAVAVIGAMLVTNQNFMGLLPNMPYGCALLFGICTLALALLLACAAYYCFAFTLQMIRASMRWHKNMVSGNPLPPLPLSPQFSGKVKRRLRTLMNWALIVFGVMFVLASVVSQALSGAIGFWHAWNWFVK